ncbi:class I SAM-dependent methyltransferase [Natrinema altunense]|uniref:Type 11 methyltransferase n=1 Tax=Natrinema altunense (strain JCM 12890 / CGMCC 1.3731 / AJ2) TaxID=1227494 RepID=L9ZEA7_NATA2|nr:class I SAM-dependent methyltransferase [Natrinema altunense]ELY84366.1 type 11 methyltransferase [Natrinema altunense JCM 12890]
MRANETRKRNVERTFERCIEPHVRDETVLDIGCVAHDSAKRHDETWLHDLVVRAADDALGVDVLEDELAALADAGYDVTAGDAQDLALGETFDVIVIGELIEHLVDFDGLLTSVDEHLADGGKLVVTTPNAMAVHWTALRLLDQAFVNTGHTCWFDATTLRQLLERYGFEPVEITYVGDCRPTLEDPLQIAGWLCERILPDRVGKSTLAVVASRSGE